MIKCKFVYIFVLFTIVICYVTSLVYVHYRVVYLLHNLSIRAVLTAINITEIQVI